jgi:hypothetical protein
MSVLDLNEENKQIGFVKLAGCQPVKIPANAMKVIQWTTRRTKSNNRVPDTAIVQAISSENGSLPKNILLVDTCVEIRDGLVPVKLMNIGQEDLWLSPKTRLGIVHSAEVLQSSEDEYKVEIIPQTELLIRHIATQEGQEQNIVNNDQTSHSPFSEKLDVNDIEFSEEQRHKWGKSATKA